MQTAIFLALTVSLLSGCYAPAEAAGPSSAGAGAPAATKASSPAAAGSDGEQNETAPDAYPRVTAVEKAILGQTFEWEPLPTRLERMERKAFGKSSDSDDLSARTDALYDYAEQTLHKNPFKAEYSSEAAADQRLDGGDSDDSSGSRAGNDNAGAASSGSDYPHVTALEKAILGETFVKDQLSDRLARMENKAFGSPSTADLSDRTDALEKYAEKKLHVKPFGADERAAMDDSSPGSPSAKGPGMSKLAAVGTTLLNMAGIPLVPGFGGVRVGQRQVPTQDQQLEAQKIQQQLEDPLLKASTPPPAGAKLLTKVGWCELQVFGQTNATMHLVDRLNNLNQTLKFDPGKSGIDLMDHIDALMKIAQSQKKPTQSVGSLSPTQ